MRVFTAGERRAGHIDPFGQGGNPLGASLARGLLVSPIALQRDRTAHRAVGAVALLAEFHEQLLPEQAQPEDDLFAGQLRVDLSVGAGDGNARIASHLAPLGLAGEGAEPLPGADRAQTPLGQTRQPVLDAAVRLAAVGLVVVA